MSALLAALAAGVLVAVLVPPAAGRPRARNVRDVPRPRSARPPGVVGRSTPGGRTADRTVLGVIGRLGRVVRRRGARGPELGIVCASVAARVRSGQAPSAAWASELGVSSASGAGRPAPDALAWGGHAGVGGASPVGARVDAEGQPGELLALVGRSSGADAAYVATRVALRSGAPLADVLDAVAVAVAEAEAAEADRRRARAGPATTARLLGWLPLGALLLGAGLGADPVAIVLGGGPGLLAMVAGALLMVAGRWWSARLVRAATLDDDAGAARVGG